jgi:hypothetical protein
VRSSLDNLLADPDIWLKRKLCFLVFLFVLSCYFLLGIYCIKEFYCGLSIHAYNVF